MPEEFKVGDQVQLKSGGPTMTVTKEVGVSPNISHVRCDWFAGKKTEWTYFPPEALVSAPAQGQTGKK